MRIYHYVLQLLPLLQYSNNMKESFHHRIYYVGRGNSSYTMYDVLIMVICSPPQLVRTPGWVWFLCNTTLLARGVVSCCGLSVAVLLPYWWYSFVLLAGSPAWHHLLKSEAFSYGILNQSVIVVSPLLNLLPKKFHIDVLLLVVVVEEEVLSVLLL